MLHTSFSPIATATSSTHLNASKILIVVRVMLSSDIVLRFTSIMRSPYFRLASSCAALSTVLLSVSVASHDRLTGTTSFFVTAYTSSIPSPVEDASPVLEGELLGSKSLHECSANPVYEYSISMESSESTKVIPVVNNNFERHNLITPGNKSEQEDLTGKMITSEGAIRDLLPMPFPNAEMASRAIEDAVSNPAHQGLQN